MTRNLSNSSIGNPLLESTAYHLFGHFFPIVTFIHSSPKDDSFPFPTSNFCTKLKVQWSQNNSQDNLPFIASNYVYILYIKYILNINP